MLLAVVTALLATCGKVRETSAAFTKVSKKSYALQLSVENDVESTSSALQDFDSLLKFAKQQKLSRLRTKIFQAATFLVWDTSGIFGWQFSWRFEDI